MPAQQVTDRHMDKEQFVEWCKNQIPQSRSSTSRIIVNNDEMVRFRLREEGTPEDIVLIRSRNVDTIRFEKGDEVRGFHSHRREFTFHDKTMIVRTKDGQEICRAGTGTRNKKGPFPL